jgi:capsular exopolysaccharide synthesis family protein
MGPENKSGISIPYNDGPPGVRLQDGADIPPAYGTAVGPVPRLWDYWPILLRHKWLIVSAVIVALALGTIVALSAIPLYQAVGRIVINREGADSGGLRSAVPDASESDDDYMVAMDTQTHVLESDAIARLVISKLGLDSNSSFVGKRAPAQNQPGDPVISEVHEIDNQRAAALVSRFHQSLQVSSIPRTRLVEIRFSSPDPVLAAKVVNAVIDTYIEQNYKTHVEATTRTLDWLTGQLSELQMKVEQSQEKLVQYQKEHEILGIDEKQNIVTSRLDELNRELTAAEGERMQKESVYRLATSGDPDLLSNLESTNPILKLRSQEADLHRQIAEASAKFQPTYPKVVELREELAAVQADIEVEVGRLAEKYKKDYLAALEREKLLRASLENQKGAENKLNESAIEYSLLKRDFDTNRQLYEGLLQKLKEAGVMTGLRSSNVRIVDPALPPASPSSPNIPRSLMMSLLVGLIAGVSLAFILESRDDTVHSLEQARMVVALPSLGVVPLASRANRLLLRSKNNGRALPTAASASSPRSQIAEAYRALRTSILLSRSGQSAKVLIVTSSLPQEGKTTTSVNLAAVFAQHGARVLLIEGDMRQGRISQALGLSSEVGLSTVLGQDGDVESAIASVPNIPNLSVMLAGPVPVNPAVMLDSPKMRSLLDVLRSKYEYVIIDTPPVLSATDAVLLSKLADSTVLVIRAGSTSKAALRRVYAILSHVEASIMGVILNAADTSDPDHYYYYSRRYRAYYRDSIG